MWLGWNLQIILVTHQNISKSGNIKTVFRFWYEECIPTCTWPQTVILFDVFSNVIIIASYQTFKKSTEKVWFEFRRLEYSHLRFQVSQFALFLKCWGTVLHSCGQRCLNHFFRFFFFFFFSLKIYIHNQRSIQYLCFLWITNHDRI